VWNSSAARGDADAGRTPFGIHLAVAGLGYLLFIGFLVNRYGELTWDGTTSAWYLTVFALAIGLGLSRRWIRALRAEAARTAELEVLINNTESRKKESHGA